MRISHIFLTMNRGVLVKDTLDRNRASAGRPWDELVWVDNGSTDGTVEIALAEKPDVLILHKDNLGCSKGLNRAMALSSGDWVSMVGDRNIMPHNWLKMAAEIAETGEIDVLMFDESDRHLHPERNAPGDERQFAGHRCVPSMPYGSLFFRRSILSTAGYLREDLGLYGWNDVEWMHRLAARQVRCYWLADHAMSRQPDVPMLINEQDYRAWRDEQVNDPAKKEKLAWCEKNGYPAFNPFG